MGDLRPKEIEEAEFIFGILQGGGVLDSVELPTLIRSMKLNPSLERLEKIGVAKKPGEKKLKFEEVLAVLNELKKEVKDQGCYEDFIECLKLYDKAENGHMLVGELEHNLKSLGEKLTDAEVNELFDDCLDEENDDGEIEYIPFLQRMCEKAPPLTPQKKK